MSWLLAVVWLRTDAIAPWRNGWNWTTDKLRSFGTKSASADSLALTALNDESQEVHEWNYTGEYSGKVVSKMLWNRWRLYTCCSAICPIKMQYHWSSKDTTSWLQHFSTGGQTQSLRMFKAALNLTIGLTNEGRSMIKGSRGKHKCFTKILNRTLTLEKMKGTAVRQHLSHLAV